MIDKIGSYLTNPTLVSIAQNTKAAVSIETGLKAVGRPMFTLADKNVDEKTRKYAAAKELIYQGLCLGIYMAIIIPIFKKGTFGIYKKIFKGEKEFETFKNASEFLDYHSLAVLSDKGSIMKERAAAKLKKAVKLETYVGNTKKLEKAAQLRTKAQELDVAGSKLRKEEIDKLPSDLQKLLRDEHGIERANSDIEKFENAKGAIEFSSLIGSVLGLTIIAPEMSHLVLHPILRAVGLEKKEAAKENQKAEVKTGEAQKLDKKV